MNFSRHRLLLRIVSLGISCAVVCAAWNALGAPRHQDLGFSDIRVNREHRLRNGQLVKLRGTKLAIKFVAVENDSRCPSDVTCVWAGNASVRLRLSSGRNSRTVKLNTSGGSSLPAETEFRGYKVKLVGLSPYPRSGRKIPARDYIATLLVSKQ